MGEDEKLDLSKVELLARVGSFTPEKDGKLEDWLLKNGVKEVTEWGKRKGSKAVQKLEKELELGETNIELWKTHTQRIIPVRAVHVLRGKVCSPESREQDIFLMNTWQQLADGQFRYRNGLLSEKLGTDELPFQHHLLKAGTRAATEEEMARLVPKTFRIGESEIPVYDPQAKSPLEVLDVIWQDEITEIEESKSFPGLLTMYLLYTVDIVCANLPEDDFNTLEYEPCKLGNGHKLKYVHSWQWTTWSQLKLHLFEGSTCREKPKNFKTVEDMEKWLSKNGGDLLANQLKTWGNVPGTKPLAALHAELNAGETALELWSKKNGVSLIVRVVHVFRGKIMNDSLPGAFLFNTFETLLPKPHMLTPRLDPKTGLTLPNEPGANSTTGSQERKIAKNLFITEKLILQEGQTMAELLTETAQKIIQKRIMKIFPEDFELNRYFPEQKGGIGRLSRMSIRPDMPLPNLSRGSQLQRAVTPPGGPSQDGETRPNSKGPGSRASQRGSQLDGTVGLLAKEQDLVEKSPSDNPLTKDDGKSAGPISRLSLEQKNQITGKKQAQDHLAEEIKQTVANFDVSSPSAKTTSNADDTGALGSDHLLLERLTEERTKKNHSEYLRGMGTTDFNDTSMALGVAEYIQTGATSSGKIADRGAPAAGAAPETGAQTEAPRTEPQNGTPRTGEAIRNSKELLGASLGKSLPSSGNHPLAYDASKVPEIEFDEVRFRDQTYEVEESRGFPGLLTVYHLYTVEIHQTGLPETNFVSIQYKPEVATPNDEPKGLLRPSGGKDSSATFLTMVSPRETLDALRVKHIFHWRWVTWTQVLDLLNRRVHHLENQEKIAKNKLAHTLLLNQSSFNKIQQVSKIFDGLKLKGIETESIGYILSELSNDLQLAIQAQLKDLQTEVLPPDVLQSCVATGGDSTIALQPTEVTATKGAEIGKSFAGQLGRGSSSKESPGYHASAFRDQLSVDTFGNQLNVGKVDTVSSELTVLPGPASKGKSAAFKSLNRQGTAGGFAGLASEGLVLLDKRSGGSSDKSRTLIVGKTQTIQPDGSIVNNALGDYRGGKRVPGKEVSCQTDDDVGMSMNNIVSAELQLQMQEWKRHLQNGNLHSPNSSPNSSPLSPQAIKDINRLLGGAPNTLGGPQIITSPRGSPTKTSSLASPVSSPEMAYGESNKTSPTLPPPNSSGRNGDGRANSREKYMDTSNFTWKQKFNMGAFNNYITQERFFPSPKIQSQRSRDDASSLVSYMHMYQNRVGSAQDSKGGTNVQNVDGTVHGVGNAGGNTVGNQETKSTMLTAYLPGSNSFITPRSVSFPDHSPGKLAAIKGGYVELMTNSSHNVSVDTSIFAPGSAGGDPDNAAGGGETPFGSKSKQGITTGVSPIPEGSDSLAPSSPSQLTYNYPVAGAPSSFFQREQGDAHYNGVQGGAYYNGAQGGAYYNAQLESISQAVNRVVGSDLNGKNLNTNSAGAYKANLLGSYSGTTKVRSFSSGEIHFQPGSILDEVLMRENQGPTPFRVVRDITPLRKQYPRKREGQADEKVAKFVLNSRENQEGTVEYAAKAAKVSPKDSNHAERIVA